MQKTSTFVANLIKIGLNLDTNLKCMNQLLLRYDNKPLSYSYRSLFCSRCKDKKL